MEIIVAPTGSGISAHLINEQIRRRQGTHRQDNRAHSQSGTSQGMGRDLLAGGSGGTYFRMDGEANETGRH